jgi:ATP-dependent Clp protease adaptor protein ClpS
MPQRREPRASKPRTKPTDKPQTRRVPPYHVVLANDDDHTIEFVIDVLRKVLGAPLERAVQLTMEAHSSGRAVIWTGPKEVAELKVEQVTTYHEVRSGDGAQLGPLTCTIEPAP